MSRLRLLHPLLFAAFPVWSLYGSHAARVPLSELAGPLAAALGLGALAWGGARLLLRDAERSALVASAAVGAFWATGPLAERLPGAEGGAALAAAAGLLALAVGGLARALRRVERTLPGWNAALAAAGLALVLLPGVEVARTAWAADETGSGAPAEVGHATHATAPAADAAPDVYWLVLDAYGREDVLDARYGLARDLSDRLREQGFYVAQRSAANYSTTIHSLAATLNLGYVQHLVPRASRGPGLVSLVERVRESRLVGHLRARGYRFVAYSSGFALTEIPGADTVVAPARRMGEFQVAALEMTPLARLGGWLERSPYDLRRQRILEAIERLPNHAEDPEPTFVFWHMLVPHHPFVFGPGGEDVSPRDRPFTYKGGGLNGRRTRPGVPQPEYLEAYAAQVRFLTERLGDALAELLRRSEGRAVVIVQGDHGPNSTWPHVDPSERLPILNALHLPEATERGGPEPYPEISPVNTFRLVLSRYLGADLPLLEDRHYLASYDRPFQFEEVAGARVRGPETTASSGARPDGPVSGSSGPPTRTVGSPASSR